MQKRVVESEPTLSGPLRLKVARGPQGRWQCPRRLGCRLYLGITEASAPIKTPRAALHSPRSGLPSTPHAQSCPSHLDPLPLSPKAHIPGCKPKPLCPCAVHRHSKQDISRTKASAILHISWHPAPQRPSTPLSPPPPSPTLPLPGFCSSLGPSLSHPQSPLLLPDPLLVISCSSSHKSLLQGGPL